MDDVTPLRNQGHSSARLLLRPVPPFRLDLTVWALRRRPRNQIDRWDGRTYRRVMVVRGRPTELAITQEGTVAAPELIVEVTPRPRTRSDEAHVRSIVERLLGLQIALDDWYLTSTRDSRLRLIADKFRGVKPPRFPTMLEAVVNAFACQQLSLEVGLDLLNRLAATGSVSLGTFHPFPAAHDLAAVQPERYRAIGFSRQKATAIRELADVVTLGRLDLERLAQEDDAEARRHLTDLRGVGRWTAEYVLLRGLGRLHVFPGDDVGAQKRLGSWLGHPGPMGYADVARAVQRWQPYAGFVYLHLLLEGLSQAGILSSRSAGPATSQARPTFDAV
jgi:DNA-3-methyladenine glycosylase II